MKATFENSVNVLVKAYMNDTLVHANCYACAVGNIIAAARGDSYTEVTTRGWERKKIALRSNNGKYVVEGLFGERVLSGGAWCTFIWNGLNAALGQIDVDDSGYSVPELKRIEQAFESHALDRLDGDDAMFNALMAVIDVLADIHQVDLTVKEEAKKAFVKPVLV